MFFIQLKIWNLEMSDSIFNLNHREFESQAPDLIRKLRNDKYFVDVSLVSSDGEQFDAHKAIISARSKMLSKILVANSHSKPLIYLTDVTKVQLKMMMDFIYIGECKVPEDCLEDFLEIGTKLQVEGMAQTKNSKNEHMT